MNKIEEFEQAKENLLVELFETTDIKCNYCIEPNVIISDEFLNDDVPLEVRFKHLLRENGKLKAHIQELEFTNNQLTQELARRETPAMKTRGAEIAQLNSVLQERNAKIKELRQELWEAKGGNPDNLRYENKHLRGLLHFIESKYELNIEDERKAYLK